MFAVSAHGEAQLVGGEQLLAAGLAGTRQAARREHAPAAIAGDQGLVFAELAGLRVLLDPPAPVELAEHHELGPLVAGQAQQLVFGDAHFAVRSSCDQRGRGVVDEHEAHVVGEDQLRVAHEGELFTLGQAASPEARAVAAAEVLHAPACAVPADLGVVAGDSGVIDTQDTGRGATDDVARGEVMFRARGEVTKPAHEACLAWPMGDLLPAS